MKKTSVYLSEAELDKLARAAEVEGRSQADILRSAIDDYLPRAPMERRFLSFDAGEGPGTSIADEDMDELMKDFGADSLG